MFRTKGDIIPANIQELIAQAEKNYLIQPSDIIEINVFTDKGEVIIAPAGTYKTEGQGNQPQQQQLMMNPMMMGAGVGVGGSMVGTMPGASQQFMPLNLPFFLVRNDGKVKIPRIGDTHLAGLTLHQADSLLEKKFEQLYENVFVRTRYAGKRVVVFKGEFGTIVPLVNEKTTLIEVLALTGGVSSNVRVKNIRLIRGDLQNPLVYVINLSTIEGMRRVNLTLQPNDIIYLEPTRKFIFEAVAQITSLITIFNTILLIFAIRRN
ncbi:MAG: polysaccharide biosynthesis/export family protein [Microscillaceae bacterium]|nr:polysaccharide biosynthesis/export family protein [Microscillaceae bacterium]MDW8461124.1 polysaccharide biosynthesis/export family protein [Cytophagales bacterium]